MNDSRNDDAWLVRPDSIRLLWRVFWAVLALTVIAQLVVKVKGYAGIDGVKPVGISAFPSMHLCMATLNMVYAFRFGRLWGWTIGIFWGIGVSWPSPNLVHIDCDMPGVSFSWRR